MTRNRPSPARQILGLVVAIVAAVAFFASRAHFEPEARPGYDPAAAIREIDRDLENYRRQLDQRFSHHEMMRRAAEHAANPANWDR